MIMIKFDDDDDDKGNGNSKNNYAKDYLKTDSGCILSYNSWLVFVRSILL